MKDQEVKKRVVLNLFQKRKFVVSMVKKLPVASKVSKISDSTLLTSSTKSWGKFHLNFNYIYIFYVVNSNESPCDGSNPNYIGCYVDDSNRDLDHGPGVNPKKYDASSCNAECKGYNYFSLQAQGQCFCGNAFATSPKYEKRPDAECGGAKGIGRAWRNSVYKTCGNET